MNTFLKSTLKSTLVAVLCVGLTTSTYTALAQSIIGGGSGSGTVNSGTAPGVAYYAANGTAVSDGSAAAVKAGTLALNGCTIGSGSLCVTGTGNFSGTLSTSGAIIAGAAQQIYWSTRTTLQAPSNGALQVGDNSLTNSFTITAGASNLATFNGGVTATGNVIANNSVFSGGPFYTLSGSQNSTGIRAGAASDAILSRAAAATWQLGAADVDTAPVAQTLRSQGALTGGTNNVAGANWTFIASPGKGTGAGGSFIFQTAPAGGSGNTPNTPVTALTIDSTGNSTFASNVFSSANVQAGSSSAFVINARSSIRSSSDGTFQFRNNANSTDATLTAAGITLSGLSASSAVCTDGSKVLTTSGCSSSLVQFAAESSSDQTPVANDTATKVTFGTEISDPSNVFASSTFTAPSTGVYSCQVKLAASATTMNRIRIAMYKNGSLDRYIQWSDMTAVTGSQIVTGVYEASLTATNTLEVYGRVTTAGATDSTFNGTSGFNSSFACQKVA